MHNPTIEASITDHKVRAPTEDQHRHTHGICIADQVNDVLPRARYLVVCSLATHMHGCQFDEALAHGHSRYLAALKEWGTASGGDGQHAPAGCP